MKHLALRFSIIVATFTILVGCASIVVEPEPMRITPTFDYTPPEAMPGSAEVTFAVVGAQIETPVPLFRDFASNMTKDFGEILTARGFSVKGPFNEYDLMTFSDKEGSDLVLTAEVDFSYDTTQLSYSTTGRLDGTVVVRGHVNLVAYESLTKNRLWTKSVAITPVVIELASRNRYPTRPRLATLLVNENKFYSDIGRALEAQYTEIMNKIYGYLEPKEMAIVKQAASDLRRREVVQ